MFVINVHPWCLKIAPIHVKHTYQYRLEISRAQMVTQGNFSLPTTGIKCQRAAWQLSILSSIFNEAFSNEPMHSVHHLYMMSTHAVILGSTLCASSYKAHITLKLVLLASLGSCLETFYSFQSNAGQQKEPEWDSTFWDFTFASIKQGYNWQLDYSFYTATLENVRRSQEVKSLCSRPAHFGWTGFSL